MFDRTEYLAVLGRSAGSGKASSGASGHLGPSRRFLELLGRLGPARTAALFLGVGVAVVLGIFLLDKPDPQPSSMEDLGLGRGSVGGVSAEPEKGDHRSLPPGRLPVGVFVTGAVNAPGVYYFNEGRRVVDAIEAAGGPRSEADLSRINLAAPLEDGVRIYVPKAGEDPPSDSAAGGTSQGMGLSGAGGVSQPVLGGAQKVNVNKAPASELEKLPGIGPALAQRIVEDRSRNGPYRALQDLSRIPGIGDVKISQLAPFVTF